VSERVDLRKELAALAGPFQPMTVATMTRAQ